LVGDLRQEGLVCGLAAGIDEQSPILEVDVERRVLSSTGAREQRIGERRVNRRSAGAVESDQNIGRDLLHFE
jgi:hypothetical protein